MLEGNRCERCEKTIVGERAKRKQTKYCKKCAKIKKRQNSLDSWPPEKRKEYTAVYMREYRRKHPALSTKYVRKHRKKKQAERATTRVPKEQLALQPVLETLNSVAYPLVYLLLISQPVIFSELAGVQLSFEGIRTIITHLGSLVIEATGFIVTVIFCLRHLRDLWREMKK